MLIKIYFKVNNLKNIEIVLDKKYHRNLMEKEHKVKIIMILDQKYKKNILDHD